MPRSDRALPRLAILAVLLSCLCGACELVARFPEQPDAGGDADGDGDGDVDADADVDGGCTAHCEGTASVGCANVMIELVCDSIPGCSRQPTCVVRGEAASCDELTAELCEVCGCSFVDESCSGESTVPCAGADPSHCAECGCLTDTVCAGVIDCTRLDLTHCEMAGCTWVSCG